MVATLDDTKRHAIAIELTDLKAEKELLMATEQKLLLTLGSNPEISTRFNDFLKDD